MLRKPNDGKSIREEDKYTKVQVDIKTSLNLVSFGGKLLSNESEVSDADGDDVGGVCDDAQHNLGKLRGAGGARVCLLWLLGSRG